MAIVEGVDGVEFFGELVDIDEGGESPGLAFGHFAVAAGAGGAGHEDRGAFFEFGEAGDGADEAAQHPFVFADVAAVVGFDCGLHVEFCGREEAGVVNEVGEQAAEGVG